MVKLAHDQVTPNTRHRMRGFSQRVRQERADLLAQLARLKDTTYDRITLRSIRHLEQTIQEDMRGYEETDTKTKKLSLATMMIGTLAIAFYFTKYIQDISKPMNALVGAGIGACIFAISLLFSKKQTTKEFDALTKEFEQHVARYKQQIGLILPDISRDVGDTKQNRAKRPEATETQTALVSDNQAPQKDGAGDVPVIMDSDLTEAKENLNPGTVLSFRGLCDMGDCVWPTDTYYIKVGEGDRQIIVDIALLPSYQPGANGNHQMMVRIPEAIRGELDLIDVWGNAPMTMTDAMKEIESWGEDSGEEIRKRIGKGLEITTGFGYCQNQEILLKLCRIVSNYLSHDLDANKVIGLSEFIDKEYEKLIATQGDDGVN